MVDRLYWMWQATHYDKRKTISGTVCGSEGKYPLTTCGKFADHSQITFGNRPVSRNATLEDLIELPFLAVEPATIGSLLDTLDGPYCYIYE